jgi:hypothetical protein
VRVTCRLRERAKKARFRYDKSYGDVLDETHAAFQNINKKQNGSIMTTFEQKRAFEMLSKKCKTNGQRITNHQSGWTEEFGAIGEGRLPRVGVEEQFPQGDAGDIAQALAYVQQVAETYPDDFCRWAATSNILNKVTGDGVRKGAVNQSGQNSDPIHYPANAIGSTPGAGKSVWTKDLNTGNPNEAQLKRLIEGAEELLQQARMHEGHLKAKVLHRSKL